MPEFVGRLTGGIGEHGEQRQASLRSNIIGEQGDLFFQQWALGHQLSANKAVKDVGVDFFCQLVTPVGDARSVEVQGPILAAQVKTVEGGDDAHLSLNRVDATNLLRQTHATCLFGIRLSDHSVHFQFMDRGFIDRLLCDVLWLPSLSRQRNVHPDTCSRKSFGFAGLPEFPRKAPSASGTRVARSRSSSSLEGR